MKLKLGSNYLSVQRMGVVCTRTHLRAISNAGYRFTDSITDIKPATKCLPYTSVDKPSSRHA